ncbi:DUF6504 family protein [Kribbella sp. NPDC051770]|uniref:DUF6504 family protein n=1 Tax=Kribbella sp. NPDC051770 TaxID=3155413 RepID=UPI00342E41C5
MMWEFDEAVEVRSGVVDGIESPEQFLWHGRLWLVCAIRSHHTETAAWWERGIIGQGVGATSAPHDHFTAPLSSVAHSSTTRGATAPGSSARGSAAAAGSTPGSTSPSSAAVGVLDADWGPRRTVFRVEAGAGRHAPRELFDLAHDPNSGRWQLERVSAA